MEEFYFHIEEQESPNFNQTSEHFEKRFGFGAQDLTKIEKTFKFEFLKEVKSDFANEFFNQVL